MISLMRLYSVAIVFGVLAAIRFYGLESDKLIGALIALAGVCVIVAEKERQRLVRKHRGGYRRRRDDP